jgi:hypothetical protein
MMWYQKTMPRVRCHTACVFLLSLLLLIGCADGSESLNNTESQGGAMSQLPLCSTGPAVLAQSGNRVRVSGRYKIAELGRHRIMEEMPDNTMRSSNRIGSLILDDQVSVRLGIRSDEEMKRFDGKRVVIVGKTFAPTPTSGAPIMAQPNAAPVLREIESVELEAD